MRIDRNRVRNVFKNYTDLYDATDEKIKLKIDHTYRVAELCERIAASFGMSQVDKDLAWLLGMLHDIGRFEQLRNYGTFNDAESVDHAALGADLLFADGAMKKIRDYLEDTSEDVLIERAVRVHSAYRLPENMEERTKRFSEILRDADKVDILRVNVEIPLEEIYNVTSEELRHAEVTDAVLESFFEHHAVLKSLKRTAVDHIVGHCSLVFELVSKESLRIVKEQGYLWRMMKFDTKNPKTAEQFAIMREEMERYLAAI